LFPCNLDSPLSKSRIIFLLQRCSRVCRRLYFLCWDSDLWRAITLNGETVEADLALKTIARLLARNGSKQSIVRINLNSCSKLTDRGLAVIARTCPQLDHIELRNCNNISNGGLMDLVSRCQMISHLDVSGEYFLFML